MFKFRGLVGLKLTKKIRLYFKFLMYGMKILPYDYDAINSNFYEF